MKPTKESNLNNISTLFSNCCDAFIIYINNIMICSECGEIKHTIEDDEEITIGIEYNVVNEKANLNDTDSKNVNSDIIKNQYQKAKRCANDITYTLVNKRCPNVINGKVCNGMCRFGRDANENKMFICTKCRNVFSE